MNLYQKRFSLLCLLTILCGPVFAQRASVSGTVIDQSGGVIAGATVTAVKTDQGLKREAVTNDEGHFAIPLLQPGVYLITAQREGFTPTEIRDVALNVGDERSLQIQMKVGAVGDSVIVKADANTVREDPAVSTVVDRQFVENLPLNGRSFNSLIAITPGVVQTKALFGNPGQFSVNGQRSDANYFTVDGVSANFGSSNSAANSTTISGSTPALTSLGGTNNLVSIDALQEFKVQTSTYAPEFGRTPGAQISLITRSGTNEFHGSLFNYLRNDSFDANNWFANRNGLPKPALRQNNFGGTFSGPLFLPRFGEGASAFYNGRNRTFFFFSYEGLRLRQPRVLSNVEVPSLSLRRSAAPQIQPYLNAFAPPNGPELIDPLTGQPNGLALFSAGYSAPSDFDATSLRLDHVFNNKVTLFGRYNDAPSESSTRSASSLNSFVNNYDTTSLTLGGTLLLSPKIINDLRVNYSKISVAGFFAQDDFGGAVPLPESQLFPSFAAPENSVVAFTLNYSTRPEVRVGSNAHNFQRQLNLVDTFSISTGNHQLKFGIDYRRLSPTTGPVAYVQIAHFNNIAAVRAATASTLATLANQQSRILFKNFSAFGQDVWKAARRLTLTYGMRWEVNPPPQSADGNDAYTATGLDNPATIKLAPRGTPLYKTTYNNFAPRLGVAYQLFTRQGWETIVRGGAGVFYDLGSNQAAGGYFAPPFSTGFVSVANIPYPPTGSRILPPPFPAFPSFRTVAAPNPNLKLPRTYQWNLALEQFLGSNQTISASYVGAAGRKLLNLKILQAPNPSFDMVTIINNEATSDYHALQLQYQRRLAGGLQAFAGYTWSHAIDLVSFTSLGLDRGSSDFDVRHSFSTAITYNLPTPRSGRVVKPILRSWSVDTIIRAQSSTPVNLISSTFVNLAGTTAIIRPDLIPGIPLYIDDPLSPGGRRFNNTIDPSRPGCKGPFCIPPAGRQGTLGRNVLRGFPLSQTDLSFRRQFSLGERLKLQLRGDIFNIFNHPNFGDPINTLTSATFGQSTSMLGNSLSVSNQGFNPLYQIGGPRSIQLSLKLQL